MKKILIIALLLVSFVGLQAQVGRVYSMTVDTVKSNETIYIATGQITGGYETLTIQALCTQIGGTTDGTLTLQGSVDGTSYVALTDATGFVKGYPNDSLTMTNGAVTSWVILDNPYNDYRLKIAGTASDTTKITAKYVYK